MKFKWTFLSVFLLAIPTYAGEVQYNIRVDGITCPFCVATSARALKKIDGVREVASDLESGTIFVCAEEEVEFSDPQLRKLFRDKGFTYRSHEKTERCTFGASGDANELDEKHKAHEDHGDAGR